MHGLGDDVGGEFTHIAILELGALAQVFPPKSFFGRETYFFRSAKNTQKNRQTPNKERPMFDTMRIAPPPSSQFYN